MRMDPDRQQITAAYLVNNSSEHELLKILRNYGEGRFARKIVGTILAVRETKPFETTRELAELVGKVIPKRLQKQSFNPATLTFQALRIAVNNELQELSLLLEQVPARLKPNGRLSIITFHSLEDRIVKHTFRAQAKGCTCPPSTPVCICGGTVTLRLLVRRPVTPQPEEIDRNPRARSARLRAAVRVAAEAA